jgi:hypothetical protein
MNPGRELDLSLGKKNNIVISAIDDSNHPFPFPRLAMQLLSAIYIFCSARIFVGGYNNRSILSNDVGFHFTPQYVVYRFR